MGLDLKKIVIIMADSKEEKLVIYPSSLQFKISLTSTKQ